MCLFVLRLAYNALCSLVAFPYICCGCFFSPLLSHPSVTWLRPPNASILLPCHMGPVTLSPSLKLSYALGPFSDCETHAFTQPTYTHVHKN